MLTTCISCVPFACCQLLALVKAFVSGVTCTCHTQFVLVSGLQLVSMSCFCCIVFNYGKQRTPVDCGGESCWILLLALRLCTQDMLSNHLMMSWWRVLIRSTAPATPADVEENTSVQTTSSSLVQTLPISLKKESHWWITTSACFVIWRDYLACELVGYLHELWYAKWNHG